MLLVLPGLNKMFWTGVHLDKTLTDVFYSKMATISAKENSNMFITLFTSWL